MPALLTRTSSRDSASRTSPASRRTSSSEARSARYPRAPGSSASVSSMRSCERPWTSTMPPPPATARARPRPRPSVAPVMRTTFPSRSYGAMPIDSQTEMAATTRRRKHWGWGYEDEQPSPEEVRAAAQGIAPVLGFGSPEPEEPVPLEAVELAEPRVEPPPDLDEICSADAYDRAAHSYGKAYRDIVRAFRGRFDHPPDLVAFPRDETDVERVLEWCESVGAAAIPYGGGTSVVGGVEPRFDGPAVSLDLRRLDQVLEVDQTSRAARIQGGALGPALEQQLHEHGLTLRHFPQSFQLSSLGGWIATRAGGHFATLYTHIDDLVESVRAITPRGTWQSRRLPGSGAGPSPDRMLIGSEGTLGVITEAWVRLQERPTHRASTGVRFPGFAVGAEAVRAISQSGLHPSNCRLLDPGEAHLTSGGDGESSLFVL